MERSNSSLKNDIRWPDGVSQSDADLTSGSLASSDRSSELFKPKMCNIPASPYPVYVATTLLFIPVAMNITAFNSVIYNKLCYQKYGNMSLCGDKSFGEDHPELQVEQGKWSNYLLYIQLLPTVFVNLMLGSYCDKVGHKLPLVLPMLGYAIGAVYLAMLATPAFFDWPVWTVLFYGLLTNMLGGFPLVIMASFSYVALVTPIEKRTISMAIAEGTLLIGVLIGETINGPIIDSFGLTTMCYISAALTFLPFFIASVFVRNIRLGHAESYTWRELIGLSHLFDAFKCVFRKRDNYGRLLLNMSFAMYALLYIAVNGWASNSFLYFIKERGLTLTQYSLYNCFITSLKGFGGPLVFLVIRKLFHPDQFHILIGAITMLTAGYIIISIEAIPSSMWIGGACLFPQTVFFASIRTLQTSICQRDELGKMFAYDAIMQVILGAAITSSAKVFYTSTLDFWPGMYLASFAFIQVINMICIFVTAKLKDKRDVSSPLMSGIHPSI